MPRRRAAGTRCPASPSRDGNGRAVAMAADHGDHVTPDQFKGRARRARNPPDVAVRRRHARADRRDPRRRHRRRDRTTTPPHRMGGHGRAHERDDTGGAHERDDTGGQGRAAPAERRTTAERSGRGGTAPTSARPRYAAAPDRRPRCHRRTSSSTPTRLAQVGTGSARSPSRRPGTRRVLRLRDRCKLIEALKEALRAALKHTTRHPAAPGLSTARSALE